jgi:hypothetical protein
MSKAQYERARNFCTGQDLATLGERQSAWANDELLVSFRKKMATVYANFFLGYQLNLMEEKENIAPPNQIYLRFENETLRYTLNVFDQEITDEISQDELKAIGIHLNSELTEAILKNELQPKLIDLLGIMGKKRYTPFFIFDDVNLTWPVFRYFLQLMPDPTSSLNPEDLHLELQKNGTLHVTIDHNGTITTEVFSADDLNRMGCGDLRWPLTPTDIEKLKRIVIEDSTQTEVDHPSHIALKTKQDGSLQYAFMDYQATIVKNIISPEKLKKLGIDPLSFPLTQEEIDARLNPKLMDIVSLLNQRQEIFPNGSESVADNFYDLTPKQQQEFLKQGLDLNLLHTDGLAPFTYLIGNAENGRVDEMLDLAQQYQTREQRLIWINKPDKMIRSDDDETKKITYVAQTALQLAIAKGYETKSGDGCSLSVSNLQLAEKLLKLGADDCINYAEPEKGNTALHIAYLRRDYNAICLLEQFGAARHIKNLAGKMPCEMLTLSFEESKELLKFHTSPNGHPSTYRLDKAQFLDETNLSTLKRHVADLEQNEDKVNFCIDVIGKLTKYLADIKNDDNKSAGLDFKIFRNTQLSNRKANMYVAEQLIESLRKVINNPSTDLTELFTQENVIKIRLEKSLGSIRSQTLNSILKEAREELAMNDNFSSSISPPDNSL